MDRPGVGIGLFVINTTKTKILIGKRIKEGLYGLPGGKLEHGEEFVPCSIRELKEETNIEIRDESRVEDVCSFNCVNLETKYHWFDVYVRIFLNDDEESSLHNNEPDKCEEWIWFTFNDLKENLENLFYPLQVFLLKYKIANLDDILNLRTV